MFYAKDMSMLDFNFLAKRGVDIVYTLGVILIQKQLCLYASRGR